VIAAHDRLYFGADMDATLNSASDRYDGCHMAGNRGAKARPAMDPGDCSAFARHAAAFRTPLILRRSGWLQAARSLIVQLRMPLTQKNGLDRRSATLVIVWD
jgi:hypothetical protein